MAVIFRNMSLLVLWVTRDAGGGRHPLLGVIISQLQK